MSELSEFLATTTINFHYQHKGRGVDGLWHFESWDVMLDGEVFPFRTSVPVLRTLHDQKNYRPKPPELADVVSCLVSDAQAMYEPFESWCGDLGYDTDSRKALNTYLECQTLGAKFLRVLRAHKLSLEDIQSKEH